MRHPVISPDTTILLIDIREGMPIYDLLSQKVGTVKRIQLPSEPLPLTVIDFKNVPESIQLRLSEMGFLQINTGLLRKDAFVLTNQVKGVVHNKVYLTILHDELLIL